MTKKPLVTSLFQFWGVFFILGIAASITIMDVMGSYRDFNSFSETIRTEYLANQKQFVKQEVLHVIDLISYEKSQSEEFARDLIKTRVYEAVAIAQNIYEQNKTTKNKNDIRKIIIDALRPIRFEDGSGYYFVTSLEGVEILFADRPEMEGRSMLYTQDIHGQYIVKDMLEILKNNGEGFYQYHWTKPGHKGSDFKKISFVKRIDGFDWFVGAGLYVDDIEKKMERNILSIISRIRFGNGGYVFVNKYNGDALVANGSLCREPKKLWEVFHENPEITRALFDKEHAAALTSDGDYIHYSIKKTVSSGKETDKISFVHGIPELQWLAGAGFYLDDVETEISMMQKALTRQIQTKVFHFSLIAAVIVVFFLMLFNRLNKRLEKDITHFISFFNRTASFDEAIDRNQIQFDELDQMAKNVNKVLADKVRAQQELMDEKEALKESELKYRNTMDSMSIGVYIIQDLVFQYVNPALVAMFGYRAEEMVGLLSPVDLVVPELRDELRKNLVSRAAGETGHLYDIKCIKSNGEIFDAMVLGAASNHEGRPASVGTLIDITERKAAEEDLKISKSRATALLEAVPDMVFRMSGEGIFLDYKADPSDLYAQSVETIIGKKNRDLVPTALADLVDRNLRIVLESGKMQTFEYQLAMPEKGWMDYEARMVKSGENEVTTIIRNITERKTAAKETARLEKQLNQAKRMESIGLMAGGVAHDLNNILSGVVGYPELILKTIPEGSELRKQIEAIQASGFRAAAVVEDLLAIARGAASARSTCPLDSLVLEYLDSLEYSKVKSFHPNVIVEHQFTAEQANILCSPVHIKKCIMNLVTNGVEAIQGYGTVTVTTRNSSIDEVTASEKNMTSGEYVILEVRDNGPGIAKESLEYIFEPFYSGKAMDRSGTGLGLTVVWNTVQDHQGKIFVESSSSGTCFQLYFPLSSEKIEVIENVAAKDRSTMNNEHILVVDDVALLRDLAGQMLESLGYKASSVSSGEEAVEFIKDNQVDVIVLDMLMDPGMNGCQTYQEIIRINPDQKAIIASGFSESDDVKKTIALGASGYIKKPYTIEEIGLAVKMALES